VKTFFGLLAFGLWVLTAHAQQKPVVYNNSEAGDTPLDRAVKKAYAEKFAITDTTAAAGYQSPKPIAGGLPATAQSADGEPLEGYVLIAYVISAEGLVEHPIVLKTTNEALNQTALDAMEEWRFVPGTVKGKPVATTAAQEFKFDIVRSGFETTNIVLYQPDEVVKKRLPGAGHLATYLEKLQSAAAETFGDTTKADVLDIVVAVRPGGKSRVWLSGSNLDTKTLQSLREKLEAIPPVQVTDGPVAFAISGKIAGGTPASEEVPMPQEWQDAVKKLPQPVVIPDGLLDAVWPAN
jgi:TonB family protein